MELTSHPDPPSWYFRVAWDLFLTDNEDDLRALTEEALRGYDHYELIRALALTAVPMIVALHGNTAYPSLMKYALIDDPGTAKHPAPAFDAPARCIFLRGTELVGPEGHARWFSITAKEAMSSEAELEALSAQMKDVSGKVAKAVEALAQRRPTRGKPIVTGHSQGGILTFALAIEHGELFSAAYPVSGWLPRPLWPDKREASVPPITALHGADDEVVSYAQSKLALDHLDKLGYDVTRRDGLGHALSPMLAKLRELLTAACGALE